VKKTGSFECSDPLLNRIWEAGALTQSVNMEDAYDDCVDRERGLYALDTLIQYHVNLACFGDQRLMKRCLELFDQSVHPSGLYRCVYPNAGDYILPDFALYVIDGFYSYFRHTGDAEFIRKCWPSITTDLSVFHALAGERADLLLRADYPDGRVPGDKRIGFLGDGEHTNNTGINCLYSCLYLIALRGAETMAGAIGEEEDAAALGQRIARLEQAIPEAFWSAERGLFADNTDKTDFSPHASLFAVKAGVASAGQKEILRGSLPPLLTPFFKNGYDPAEGFAFTTSYGLYMLDGMYRLGLAETAENVMRQGWGWFLAKGVKTTPELFSLDDSLCHAWSASPTYMLSRNLLGVNFDRDGQPDHILIDVRAGNVAWARGVYPHRLGDVRVAWHKEGGRIVYDEIRVPAGVSFEIGDGKM
ncbi:MAG: hypothetical protein FWF44_09290, partial [Defluviitaleaceae bacterium]|nr:hypothetical protein [Defluviitaleaceae bacterium]